jgi:diacylglycerol kinase family enzyme
MVRLRIINKQIKAIEQARLQRLERDPTDKMNAMIFLLVLIIGMGVETVEQLVHETSHAFRDLVYALKSIDAVRAELKQAILYIERNPKTVKSITSFPYIVRSL